MEIVREERRGVLFYVCPEMREAGFPHGFSTRVGGVSPAPWDSLNLGGSCGDDPERVSENFRRFCAAIGADILRKYNEAKDIINAVAAHHGEVEGTTVYAALTNACDALSASRPGARSETTELYLKRLEQLDTIANSFPGVDSCFALQAGREIRVVVQPEKINENQAQVMARDICSKIEKEMNYPGQIKVTIIRETRSVEYAK